MYTIIDILRAHAFEKPDDVAITYLDGGSTSSGRDLTYRELRVAMDSFADSLLERSSPGDVAVLVYPHSVDFIVAFLGCLVAGVTPAPTSAPRKNRNRDGNQKSARFATISQHAKPRLILTSESLIDNLRGYHDDRVDCEFYVTDEAVAESLAAKSGGSGRPGPSLDDIAFLQYTSGSTGNPKGVVVSHSNLVANEKAISHGIGTDDGMMSVSWLPMFHDMGLISGLLQPLYVGGRAVLFPPEVFVSNPVFWLQVLTEFRATHTGAPNFAYEMCADRLDDDAVANLDLSSLQVAYIGAEPVLAETVRKFTHRFASCGFAARNMLPCFGMAEGTLIVSGGPPNSEPPEILAVDRSALESNLAEPCRPKSDRLEIVGCGEPALGNELVIVDPETLQMLPPYRVGEAWLRGPSIADQYFRDEEATEETFRAKANGCTHHFLRTGDLGFMSDEGNFFPTGRMKELILVGGRNIYPHDVENAVRRELSLDSRFRVVAFGSPWKGTERIELLVECDGELRRLARASEKTIERIASEIRSAVTDEFDAMVGDIGFARTGGVPVTSSGKVRRSDCGEILRSARAGHEKTDVLHLSRGLLLASDQRRESQGDRGAAPVTPELRRALEGILSPSQLSVIDQRGSSVTLDDLGVDSLGKAAVIAEIERHLKIRFDSAELPANGRLAILAQLVKQHRQVEQRPQSEDRDFPSQGVVEPEVPGNSEQDTGNLSEVTRQPGPMQHSPRPIDTAPSELPRPVDSKVTSLTDFVQRDSRDLFDKTKEFREWYNDADRRGYKRYLLPVIEQRGGRALVGADRYSPEREVILFGSADYLGLAHDQRVKQAAADAIMQHGCNVASVPLVAGSTPLHKVLEQELAAMMSYDACVLFPTGHSANMATIAAMCSQHDTVVVDNRVHYSILEGVRLAHCGWRTFLHNDPDNLRDTLRQVRQTNSSRGILVVAEGVYGIAGDLADIDALNNVAAEFDARLMLDDAHAIGVLGPAGEGTAAQIGAVRNPDIVMGSLSKSLGSFGGFILASHDVVDYLRFYAKAISFAVGLPTVNAGAALEAMRIIRDEPERLASLRAKSQFLREALINEGFDEPSVSRSTIMSLEVGDEEILREVSKELFDAGVWAEGLPFPAVPRGQERLRFRIRDCHEYDDLAYAAKATGEVCRRLIPGKRTQVAAFASPESTDPEWTVVRSLTDQQAHEICRLALDQATRHEAALPWISPEFVTKYFRRGSYWNSLESNHEWRIAYAGGKMVAAFSLDIDKVANAGNPVEAAMIGACFSAENTEQLVADQISEVMRHCQDKVDVVIAPATYPVPVFGAGVQTWKAAGGKPFLETELPAEYGEQLRSLGFRIAGSKRYCRVRLQPTAIPSPPAEIHVRDFSRAEYREETANVIAPIFSETIGKLDLCVPLPESVMVGLIQDLRELVMPGFWLVAEYEGKPAGFALCYPNIVDEFRRIGGKADIADFQSILESMETADEAFLAWMAVAPEYANLGVSDAMCAELRHRLVARGYSRLWLSWEFVDGKVRMEDHVSRMGQLESTVDMPFYGAHARKGIAVPKPHFPFGGKKSRRKSPGNDRS